jgi:hypothetical protein
MEALKSMEGEQGFMIINIFDHGADLLMVGSAPEGQAVPDWQSTRGDPVDSL